MNADGKRKRIFLPWKLESALICVHLRFNLFLLSFFRCGPVALGNLRFSLKKK